MTKKIWLAEADKVLLRRAKGLLAASAKEVWPSELTDRDVRMVLEAVASTMDSAGDGETHSLEEVPDSDFQMLWLMGACRDETGAPQLGPDGRLACPFPWVGRRQKTAPPDTPIGKEVATAKAPVGKEVVAAKAAFGKEIPKGYRGKLDEFTSRLAAKRRSVPVGVQHSASTSAHELEQAKEEAARMQKQAMVQNNYLALIKGTGTSGPHQEALETIRYADPAAYRRMEKNKKEQEAHATLTQTEANKARRRLHDVMEKHAGNIAIAVTEHVMSSVTKSYNATIKEFQEYVQKGMRSFAKEMDEVAKIAAETALSNEPSKAQQNALKAASDKYDQLAKEYWKNKGPMNKRVATELGLNDAKR